MEPLFPFGYGLSYTTFEYTNLQVPSELKQENALQVKVDITNTGNRAGNEVVQLYIRDVQSSLPRPDRELKGFRKVALEKGETKTVGFNITIAELSFYNPDIKGWIAEPGDFEVLIGSSSRDIRCSGIFSLRG